MSHEPSQRLRHRATAFVRAPLATFPVGLAIAAIAGRRPLIVSLLAVPTVFDCIAALTSAGLALRRSDYAARWVFRVANGLALAVAGAIFTLPSQGLAVELFG